MPQFPACDSTLQRIRRMAEYELHKSTDAGEQTIWRSVVEMIDQELETRWVARRQAGKEDQ